MPDVDSLRAFCRSLPAVTEDMPWADDLCFKVRGKIFAGIALSDGRFPRVTLKAAPEAFHELLEIEGIAPAPYVGRYKWITLENSNVLPAHELEALIRLSYELVAAKASRKKSPANRSATSKSPARKSATRKSARSKHRRNR